MSSDQAEAGPSRAPEASGDVSMEDANAASQFTYDDYPEPSLPEGLTLNPDDPDDEDEIAHTMPIYISHNLSPAVHLFQYPVHQRKLEVSSYGQQRGQVITARMKENVGRFELEVPVDLRPSHWNEDRAEELGFLPVEESKDKGKGKRRDDKPENWGTKMRLRSEEVPNVTGYWTGIVQKGALHLHPVDKLLQLRPSLAYLDALETANRLEKEREARAKGDDDDEDEDDGMEGDAAKNKVKQEEFKTVQMQLAQRPDRTGEVRRGSKMGTAGTVGTTQVIRQNLMRSMQREIEDPWQAWGWEDQQDEATLSVLSRMLVPEGHRAPLECKTRPLDLISRKNIGEGARLPN